MAKQTQVSKKSSKNDPIAVAEQMPAKTESAKNPVTTKAPSATPRVFQRAPEIQKFGTTIRMPIGLDQKVCASSVKDLNELLADSIVMRDLYKKHHWQVSGATFYQLHLLFDKHYEEQVKIVDALAERIQLLGGISIAMAHDVAAATHIERAPQGREEVPVQISRLLEAHETLLKAARKAARAADERGDDGTNDLLVSEVVRTNELQVWFLAEHLVSGPLAEAEVSSESGGEASDESKH